MADYKSKISNAFSPTTGAMKGVDDALFNYLKTKQGKWSQNIPGVTISTQDNEVPYTPPTNQLPQIQTKKTLAIPGVNVSTPDNEVLYNTKPASFTPTEE